MRLLLWRGMSESWICTEFSIILFMLAWTIFSLKYLKNKFDAICLNSFPRCSNIVYEEDIKMSKPKPTRLDYCQFLLTTPVNYTITRFADHCERFSHDQINRYLADERLPPRYVWESVKPHIYTPYNSEPFSEYRITANFTKIWFRQNLILSFLSLLSLLVQTNLILSLLVQTKSYTVSKSKLPNLFFYLHSRGLA